MKKPLIALCGLGLAALTLQNRFQPGNAGRAGRERRTGLPEQLH